MKRGSIFLLSVMVLLSVHNVSAQQGPTNAYASGPDTTQKLTSLTPSQREGAYLFKQRCNLCHGPSEMVGFSPFGPRLSKELVEGNEDVVRNQIMNGSAHMPGFRYGLQPTQISQIIDYLKTVERPKGQQKGERDNAVD